jgi:hypothetical protein
MQKRKAKAEPLTIPVKEIVSKRLRTKWGEAVVDGTIVLNSSLKGYRRLLYLAHEAAHLARWKLTEREVRSVSTKIARVLWRDGYRRKDGR